MKNKLPRKRKKAYIKAKGRMAYVAAQVVNEILFEERKTPCRFPEIVVNQRNPKGYDILKFW